MESRAEACTLLPSSDPRIFGPAVWQALHILAAGYPQQADSEKQRRCRRFLVSLSHMLPCEHCATHFRTCLRGQDLRRAVRGREALVRFLVDTHNSVSRHTRPEQAPYGLNCAKRQYSYMRANAPLALIWTHAEPPSRRESDGVERVPAPTGCGADVALREAAFRGQDSGSDGAVKHSERYVEPPRWTNGTS
jgi:hypothetical protein